MKRNIAILVLVAMLIPALAGCGNVSLVTKNFAYARVHVTTHGFSGCLEIEEWCQLAPGMVVKTAEYGYMVLSEGTYALVEGSAECPLCAHEGQATE